MIAGEYRLGKKGNYARLFDIDPFVFGICGECFAANNRRQPSLCRRELARRVSFAQTNFRPALKMRPGFFCRMMCGFGVPASRRLMSCEEFGRSIALADCKMRAARPFDDA